MRFLSESGKRWFITWLVFCVAYALGAIIAKAQIYMVPSRSYGITYQAQVQYTPQVVQKPVVVPQTTMSPYQARYGLVLVRRWSPFRGFYYYCRPSYVLQPYVQPQPIQQPAPVPQPTEQAPTPEVQQ